MLSTFSTSNRFAVLDSSPSRHRLPAAEKRQRKIEMQQAINSRKKEKRIQLRKKRRARWKVKGEEYFSLYTKEKQQHQLVVQDLEALKKKHQEDVQYYDKEVRSLNKEIDDITRHYNEEYGKLTRKYRNKKADIEDLLKGNREKMRKFETAVQSVKVANSEIRIYEKKYGSALEQLNKMKKELEEMRKEKEDIQKQKEAADEKIKRLSFYGLQTDVSDHENDLSKCNSTKKNNEGCDDESKGIVKNSIENLTEKERFYNFGPLEKLKPRSRLLFPFKCFHRK